MIDAEHYFSWVKSNHINIYLAKINGVAVSTCATIQNGSTASLEFVSTLEQYRRKTVAALLCSYAINDLLKNGAEIVTLSACGHSVYLYEGLGFKKYFNNTIMKSFQSVHHFPYGFLMRKDITYREIGELYEADVLNIYVNETTDSYLYGQ